MTGELRVRGRGTAPPLPDIVRITVSVESRAATAKRAAEDNAEVAGRAVQLLRAAGITDRDIQTGDVRLRAGTMYLEKRSEPCITGYVVRNLFQVRIKPPERLAQLLDLLTEARVNEISEIQFGFEDITIYFLSALFRPTIYI